ncbi:type II secretion system protein M [Porticoccaceae bacterium]|nr:type II secretion system protein M [Porticoccaceae bacterium]
MKTFLRRYCQFLGQPESQQGAVATYSIAIVVFSLAIVFIMQGFYTGSKKEYQEQALLTDWLMRNTAQLSSAAELQQAATNEKTGIIKRDNRTLVMLLSETAASKNLIVSRLEHRQAKVTVNFKNTYFSELMIWLASLEKRGITVDQANITYIEKNKADATLTFTAN